MSRFKAKLSNGITLEVDAITVDEVIKKLQEELFNKLQEYKSKNKLSGTVRLYVTNSTTNINVSGFATVDLFPIMKIVYDTGSA